VCQMISYINLEFLVIILLQVGLKRDMDFTSDLSTKSGD